MVCAKHFIAIICTLQLLVNLNCGEDAASYYNSYWSITPYRHRQVLSGSEKAAKVLLEWHIDFERETIIFDLTARTTGFVGLGLLTSLRPSSSSSSSSLKEEEGLAYSDIVIGGIYPNGTVYFADCYLKTGNFSPIRDSSQDWDLHSAYENATHTFLRISRQFDTCDPRNDVRIKRKDPVDLLWALGTNDLQNSPNNVLAQQGTVENLMLVKPPPKLRSQPPPKLAGYSSWKVMTTVEMRRREYGYRCTFHWGPALETSVHAVAFLPIVSDPLAKKHVHHFIFYQCQTSPQQSYESDKYMRTQNDFRQIRTFEPLVAQTEGFDCYDPQSNIPVNLCMQTLYVWGPGEQGMYFPDQAGHLLDDELSQSYFMLEVHYENPQGRGNGGRFQVGVEVFYTPHLRQHDAGFLAVAHQISDSLFIPPHSPSFKIEGRCSEECTERAVSRGGVTVISVMLHAHLYARKIKLRHFRGDMELPWLAAEDNFRFSGQRMKPVFEQRKILPGDALVVECEYNTTSRDTVITGGFSSTSEMCTAFIWYFPKMNWDDCSSGFPTANLYNFLGYQPIVLNPRLTRLPQQNPVNFTSFVNTSVQWNDELRGNIQQLLVKSAHIASCMIAPSSEESDNYLGPPPAAFLPHIMTVAPIQLKSDEMLYQPPPPPEKMNDDKDEELRCKENKKKGLREWWKMYLNLKSS